MRSSSNILTYLTLGSFIYAFKVSLLQKTGVNKLGFLSILS